LYIGTNNYEAGKALGKEIVEMLPDGGKMAVFVGTLSADNAAQRLKGIEDAIEGKNITIVDKFMAPIQHFQTARRITPRLLSNSVTGPCWGRGRFRILLLPVRRMSITMRTIIRAA
jgi:hypothetical protein